MTAIPQKVWRLGQVLRAVNEIIDCLRRMRPRPGVNVELSETESGTRISARVPAVPAEGEEAAQEGIRHYAATVASVLGVGLFDADVVPLDDLSAVARRAALAFMEIDLDSARVSGQTFVAHGVNVKITSMEVT